jgi:outer membrane protease
MFPKINLLCIVYALCVQNAQSLDFWFDTAAGIKSGIVQEYVYEGEKCISRLDWQNTIVPTVSIFGNMDFFNFYIRIGAEFSIPVQSGIMEDYDFLISGSDEPSLYSFHNSYIDKDFSGFFALGYRFAVKKWRFIPNIAFTYTNRKWSAADGYLQYPVSGPWTGNETKEKITGTIISYEQVLWFPFVSTAVGYFLTPRWALFLEGTLYPYIWAQTRDSHFLRDKQFYDTMEGGLGGVFGLKVCLYPTGEDGGVALSFVAMYEIMSNIRGPTSSNNIGLEEGAFLITENYTAKTESKVFRIQIVASIKLPSFRT